MTKNKINRYIYTRLIKINDFNRYSSSSHTLLKKNKIFAIQDILIGLILGDAHIKKSNKSRTLRFEQSNKHKDYIHFIHNIFKIKIEGLNLSKITEWQKEHGKGSYPPKVERVFSTNPRAIAARLKRSQIGHPKHFSTSSAREGWFKNIFNKTKENFNEATGVLKIKKNKIEQKQEQEQGQGQVINTDFSSNSELNNRNLQDNRVPSTTPESSPPVNIEQETVITEQLPKNEENISVWDAHTEILNVLNQLIKNNNENEYFESLAAFQEALETAPAETFDGVFQSVKTNFGDKAESHFEYLTLLITSHLDNINQKDLSETEKIQDTLNFLNHWRLLKIELEKDLPDINFSDSSHFPYDVEFPAENSNSDVSNNQQTASSPILTEVNKVNPNFGVFGGAASPNIIETGDPEIEEGEAGPDFSALPTADEQSSSQDQDYVRQPNVQSSSQDQENVRQPRFWRLRERWGKFNLKGIFHNKNKDSRDKDDGNDYDGGNNNDSDGNGDDGLD